MYYWGIIDILIFINKFYIIHIIFINYGNTNLDNKNKEETKVIKKKSFRLATLVLTFSITTSSTVFAVTKTTKIEEKNLIKQQEQEFGKEKKPSFYESEELLKKLKLTPQEVSDVRNNGGNFFDLTKSKGFTNDQVKKIIIEEFAIYLNKKVEEGTLTKEKAEEILTKKSQRIEEWDGSFTSDKKDGRDFHFIKNKNK